MRYRIKLWTYSVYTTEKAEQLMNDMAAKGWYVKSIYMPFILFEKCEKAGQIQSKQRRYTVEVVSESRDKWYENEDQAMMDYYTSMGWELLAYLPETGACVFSSCQEQNLPKAYACSASRADQCRSRVHWGGAIAWIALAVLYLMVIGGNFGDSSENKVLGTVVLGFLIFIVLIVWLIPNSIKLIYKIFGTAGPLTKLADIMQIVLAAVKFLICIVGSIGGLYFTAKGQLFDYALWLKVPLIFITAITIPLYLHSYYEGLYRNKRKTGNNIETAAYLFGIIAIASLVGMFES